MVTSLEITKLFLEVHTSRHLPFFLCIASRKPLKDLAGLFDALAPGYSLYLSLEFRPVLLLTRKLVFNLR